MLKAPINKIIPCSAVDGPGNRTAIFLQGCNADCLYCHNPETLHPCSHCGDCVAACPAGALTVINGTVHWDASVCIDCDACIRTCRRDSTPKTMLLDSDEVIERITPNLPYIGGITVSGGECTLHTAFVAELFERVKRLGKTTFADTNGLLDFRRLERLTAAMDKAMVDFKAADPQEHWKLTGHSNAQVIDNIAYLASIGKLFEIRTVVVPDLLDNRRTVEEGSRMLASYPEVRYKLIKYRPIGVRKDKLSAASPTDEMMETLAEIARKNGVLNVVVI